MASGSLEHGIGEFASFARALARCARAETLERFSTGCAISDKGESGTFDPVTEADRSAESAIRALIVRDYPSHAISGEEWPDKAGTSAYRWSLDPIDGTRSFICGLPSWTTLIALLDHDEPRLGLVDAPALDETYVGFADCASLTSNGASRPIRTSECRRLEDARLSTTDPFLFEQDAAEAFARLQKNVRTTRYGLDGYAYARLAAGTLDLIVECGLKPHDYHALIPLVRAAGGSIGDWSGGRDFARGKIIAAASPDLFEQAVRYFDRLE